MRGQARWPGIATKPPLAEMPGSKDNCSEGQGPEWDTSGQLHVLVHLPLEQRHLESWLYKRTPSVEDIGPQALDPQKSGFRGSFEV